MERKGLIIDDLRKSIDEEDEAVRVYRQRGNMAQNLGDLETAKLYAHIAQEEETHRIEFIMRERKLKEGGNPGMDLRTRKELDDLNAMREASRMGKPRTEAERKARHEEVFGKGAKSPAERLGLGQTANDMMPMPPEEGPPLPRVFKLKWPWK